MRNASRILVLGSFVVAGVLSARPCRAQTLVSDAELRGIGLTKYWSATLPIEAGDEIAGAFLVDEHIYAISESGILFAVQVDMGLIRWAETIGSVGERVYPPHHVLTTQGDGPVVVATTTAIHVLDRYTGGVRALLRTGYTSGSAVIGVGRRLYFGSADGRFYSVIWSAEGGGKWLKEWEVMAGGPVQAAPVFHDDGKLVYGNLKGTVVSFHSEDKALEWTYQTDGAIEGDPVVDDSGVYVASMDRSLYKFDIQTGDVLWRVRTDKPLRDGPILDLHTVFQFVAGSGLLAIDAHTGKEMWRSAAGRTFLAADKERDILWTSDGRLEAVDHETGKVRGYAAGCDPCLPLTNTTGDAVILVGRDGRILCARSSSGPYLRRGDVHVAADRLNFAPREKADAALPPPIQVEPDRATEDPLRSRRDVRP